MKLGTIALSLILSPSFLFAQPINMKQALADNPPPALDCTGSGSVAVAFISAQNTTFVEAVACAGVNGTGCGGGTGVTEATGTGEFNGIGLPPCNPQVNNCLPGTSGQCHFQWTYTDGTSGAMSLSVGQSSND